MLTPAVAPLLQELNLDSLNSEVFVVFQLGTEKLQTPAIPSSRGVWGNDTWNLTSTDGSTELEAVVYQKQTLRWASMAGLTCGSASQQRVPCCWGVDSGPLPVWVLLKAVTGS